MGLTIYNPSAINTTNANLANQMDLMHDFTDYTYSFTPRTNDIILEISDTFGVADIYYQLLTYSNTPSAFRIYWYDSNNTATLLYDYATTSIPTGMIKFTTPSNCVKIRFWLGYTGTGSSQSGTIAVAYKAATMLRWYNDVHRNRGTFRIFKKVVCCGDSFTSGHMTVGGVVYSTNEEFAWPHYMAIASGNTYVNCGSSGANTHTWQEVERGLPAATASGLAQAYIIGLGINDSSSDQARHIDVGVSTDIGTTNNTYYGNYSKIIRDLKAISPDAKVFILTAPNDNPTRYDAYNAAVRDIAAAYHDTYDTHLLDLAVSGWYSNASLTGDYWESHYTAIGYQQFAEIMQIALTEYINTHISEFQDVSQIAYV